VKILEDVEWKRDETPYIVFPCRKCKQYMYVKQAQKTKKCLRCGRSHKVSDIKNSGEIVNGMTNAVKTVKARQHELAFRELGTAPEYRALGDFRPHNSLRPKRRTVESSGVENDYLPQFKKMLSELSDIYTIVPSYIFEISADDYNIPKSELEILIHSFQKIGIIIKDVRNNMYRIKLN